MTPRSRPLPPRSGAAGHAARHRESPRWTVAPLTQRAVLLATAALRAAAQRHTAAAGDPPPVPPSRPVGLAPDPVRSHRAHGGRVPAARVAAAALGAVAATAAWYGLSGAVALVEAMH